MVIFLDGRLNRPLIVGCIYNANNMPPWRCRPTKRKAAS